MNAFARLYTELDETTRTTEKVEALVRYFQQASPEDAAWAVYFLTGRRIRQVVPTRRLKAWAADLAAIPDWLFDESYDAVGDLSETIALLIPPPTRLVDRPLSLWIEDILLPMAHMDEGDQRRTLTDAWHSLDFRGRFLWNKLLGGSFRVGVSQQLVMRAIAQVSGLKVAQVAHRMMGEWKPSSTFYEQLTRPETDDGRENLSRPYPFYLAHSLEGELRALGEPSDWQAEWKWDGIRAQLIRRAGETYLWTRGEELVTDRYPEITSAGDRLRDGTVIDGEILPWKQGRPLPFAQLQRRIGRKTLGKTILTQVPVALIAFDVLEFEGRDTRSQPFHRRRELLELILEKLAQPDQIRPSPLVEFSSWDEIDEARLRSRNEQAEGLMLKRRESPYGVGRPRGDWWKWKVDPFTIDAVLTAAQRGSGKRASLYTDYTFSLWQGGKLVPIAKAYSGLTDAEIKEVDAFIRKHMIESFGPVRTVKAELVFELAFEGIQRSSRHKSGVAVRFPRILRWRTDKTTEQADELKTLQAMIPSDPSAESRKKRKQESEYLFDFDSMEDAR